MNGAHGLRALKKLEAPHARFLLHRRWCMPPYCRYGATMSSSYLDRRP
jgi:hypothetical protein